MMNLINGLCMVCRLRQPAQELQIKDPFQTCNCQVSELRYEINMNQEGSNQEVRFRECTLTKEERSVYKGFYINRDRSYELYLKGNTVFVLLPLRAEHCEKRHKLLSASVHSKRTIIVGGYCPKCSRFFVNCRAQSDLLPQKFQIPKKSPQEADAFWFAAFHQYCDDRFSSLQEYRDYEAQKRRQFRRERKQREQEEQALLEERNTTSAMNKALVRRNGEPLGNLPKQRKRGFWS